MSVKTKRYGREGFSLMEIMIAVMILGLVGAMVGPAMFKYFANAKKTTTTSTLKSVQSAINMYKMEVGQYPSKLTDLVQQPRGDDKNSKKWNGPYMGTEDNPVLPEDGYGNELKYKLTPGGKHPYELYSFGENENSPKEEWISVWDEK